MDADRSRLLWRCRRGMREMDIVLQTFLNESYDSLSDIDQNTFSKLLDEADLDILDWIMGRTKPEDEALTHIIKLIRDSRKIT